MLSYGLAGAKISSTTIALEGIQYFPSATSSASLLTGVCIPDGRRGPVKMCALLQPLPGHSSIGKSINCVTIQPLWDLRPLASQPHFSCLIKLVIQRLHISFIGILKLSLNKGVCLRAKILQEMMRHR